MFYRKIIGIILIFSISISIFVGMYSLSLPQQGGPVAKRGVLDLTGWNFDEKGAVSLQGEWEFYESMLLEPANFQQDARPEGTFFPVPGMWEGKSADGGMSKKGFGTYRLKVILPETDDVYGLKTKVIRMAHRLYINGKLEGESGSPAVTSDMHRPGNTPYSTFFHSDAREVEIVIQVANFVFAPGGGIVNPILFGHQEDITRLNSLLIGTDVATILFLGLLGTYHLGFYILRSKEKTYLYSGLYMLVLSMYQLVYGEKVLLRLFPEIPFELAYKFQDFTAYLSATLLVFFYVSIDRRILSPANMLRMIIPNLLFLAGIVIFPYSVYTHLKVVMWIYIIGIHMYILGRMVFLFFKRKEDSYKQKEVLLGIGMSVSLTIYLVNGILFAGNLLPTDIGDRIGIVCFITIMNLLLAVRFTNAYERTEILSHQLTISNQLKDEFLTNTSHEMKTPLHGILNIASRLLEDGENPLSTKQQQNLRLIKDTSIKLSMLIHDLIDVSRLKRGGLRLYPTVVDVRVAVQIVFDVLQFELLGKQVRLINEVGADVWVRADENRLRQIMYNLIHNAIKHTDKGSITVTTRQIDGHVFVSVEDTGSGVAEDKREAIFEYFEQLDQPLPQDGYTSMGVGLYISRKLVELMEGTIWVEWTEPGAGTRMTFTLTAVTDRQASLETAAAALMEQPPALPVETQLDILDQHEHTILVVDDEAANIQILLQILKRHRYNVITAFSAEEALAKINDYPQVDLAILDVMMPRVSGIELCKRLRNQYSILELPILFATIKDTPQDIVLGFRAGANDYITKPFDAETMIARVQTLLAMKTAIQEAMRNEIAFHHAQIKPHFLYNALSSVISFCYTDGEKAADLLSMLSQYLRYILDIDHTSLFVPLHRELELIQAYVEIEKARFGDRFDFVAEVEDSVLDMEIPSLCIQPFVENAIRHGLFEKEGHGKVSLSILEGDEYVKILIADDGTGIPDDVLYQMLKGKRKDDGIGIQNIRRRLDTIPGASFSIHSELGRGTRVTIYLPIQQSGHDRIV